MENLNDEAKPKQEGFEEQNIAEDLKFMRSAVEKTYWQVKPKTSNTVMWGLICIIGYVGIHFLVKKQLCNWVRPLQISLISFGVLWTIIQGHFLYKKYEQEGFFPRFMISGLCGLVIVFLPVLFFDLIGLFKGMYCGSAFIYALTINTFLVILGIVHSKLWLSGTIFVLTGILLAFTIKEYSFIILGIATGTGIILSALIVDLNYRKQEKINATA
jgi:hypothetical protein